MELFGFTVLSSRLTDITLLLKKKIMNSSTSINEGNRLRSRDFWIEDFKLKVRKILSDYCENNSLNHSQLAKKLKVNKSYISQIMNDGSNMKLSTMIKLALKVGMVPQIKFISVDLIITNTDVA